LKKIIFLEQPLGWYINPGPGQPPLEPFQQRAGGNLSEPCLKIDLASLNRDYIKVFPKKGYYLKKHFSEPKSFSKPNLNLLYAQHLNLFSTHNLNFFRRLN